MTNTPNAPAYLFANIIAFLHPFNLLNSTIAELNTNAFKS
jgi:hypothetical protein